MALRILVLGGTSLAGDPGQLHPHPGRRRCASGTGSGASRGQGGGAAPARGRAGRRVGLGDRQAAGCVRAALYRYFASRDELLTELVIDAHDLADALAASHAAARPRARLDGLARAYRSWAMAQPHRYRLLFGPLLPGYDAHAQRLGCGPAGMNQLLDTWRERGDGRLGRPPIRWHPIWRPGQNVTLGHRSGRWPCGRPHDLESAARHRAPGNRRELRHPWASTPASFSRPGIDR